MSTNKESLASRLESIEHMKLPQPVRRKMVDFHDAGRDEGVNAMRLEILGAINGSNGSHLALVVALLQLMERAEKGEV